MNDDNTLRQLAAVFNEMQLTQFPDGQPWFKVLNDWLSTSERFHDPRYYHAWKVANYGALTLADISDDYEFYAYVAEEFSDEDIRNFKREGGITE